MSLLEREIFCSSSNPVVSGISNRQRTRALKVSTMNESRLDAALVAPSNREKRLKAKCLHEFAVTASAPLLRRIPSIPGVRSKTLLSDDASLNEIRKLKQQLARAHKLNRQLQNAITFRDVKLTKKEMEVEAVLSEKSPMCARLSQEKARVRTYREKLRKLKSEAAISSEQLVELRQKCRFSQLEELRVQVDEFYAEIVRLRAKRLNDIAYVVKAAKELEDDFERKFGARKSLKKWLTTENVPARASLEYLVDCRHRLLHEVDVNALPERNEFAKHLRRVKNAIGKSGP